MTTVASQEVAKQYRGEFCLKEILIIWKTISKLILNYRKWCKNKRWNETETHRLFVVGPVSWETTIKWKKKSKYYHQITVTTSSQRHWMSSSYGFHVAFSLDSSRFVFKQIISFLDSFVLIWGQMSTYKTKSVTLCLQVRRSGYLHLFQSFC